MIKLDDVIISKTMKKWNCHYLGNEMKHEAEIYNVEVAYDADFGYGIEIRINCENQSNLMTSSIWRQWKHDMPISWWRNKVKRDLVAKGNLWCWFWLLYWNLYQPAKLVEFDDAEAHK